jgi:nitrite reductase/ring-hydroxylating ferredoxin subunit/alkylhydroperoxidase/carboxymuconolactone decarboxylase family protein YurZ
MSDALKYLMQARPEAMGHYFEFVKEAGRHLDPKTRALISVITKVATGTENGFRQYLVRALRAGLSPDEILDGLLMAFPALGLAKIVWAVDILLDMDIPEFRLEALGAAGAWHDLGSLASIAPGVSRCGNAEREVFIYRDADVLRVYDSRCPHQATNIPEAALEGCRLTCPRHRWVFDVSTGECLERGNRRLREFRCRIEGGTLQAWW